MRYFKRIMRVLLSIPAMPIWMIFLILIIIVDTCSFCFDWLNDNYLGYSYDMTKDILKAPLKIW